LLLAYAAFIAPRKTMDSWIVAAAAHGGHLAAALDLSTPACQLIDCGLAREGAWIEIAPELTALVSFGREPTLSEVAQLLLMTSPPVWLRLAVSEAGVAREYIPKDDLASLSWLEPDLDRMLQLSYQQSLPYDDGSDAKAIGDAGELFVLAALRHAGARATHVAQFSDAFGYDIEVSVPDRQRIEVKTASPKTAGQFFLTRNEFMSCKLHRSEWRLIQVVFSSAAFIAEELNRSHVTGFYTLASVSLLSIIPPDTEYFIWQESAKLRPGKDAWVRAHLPLDPDFRIPGFAAPPKDRRSHIDTDHGR
jgi:hypothetical protein